MGQDETIRPARRRASAGPAGRAAVFRRAALGLAAVLLLSPAAGAADRFTVAVQTVSDLKAVFASVESVNVVPARARIGGVVVELAVTDGDKVAGGDTVAKVADEKLALQIKSLDAEIAGLKAQ
ncbi:MAG: biotin/lipoyl-binding protein, partial [Bauldia sp.]